jgi:hypothetical protein
MEWHFHTINQARAERGMKTINSLWLWGGASSDTQQTSAAPCQTFTIPASMAPYFDAAGTAAKSSTPDQVLASASENALVVLDQLTSPALASDWSVWLQQMHALDINWFAPILSALKSGRLDTFSLILSHDLALAECRVTRRSLQCFWRKPSLAKLHP